MASIMGCNPYVSEWDVYLEKKYATEPLRETDDMLRGNLFEESVLQWVMYKKGIKNIQRNYYRVSAKNTKFACHMDAIVLPGKTVGIEAKNTKLACQWGPQGSDIYPSRHNIQCQCQMMCAPKVEYIWLGVNVPEITHWTDGEPFINIETRIYKVERDDDVIESLANIGIEWWERYIMGNEIPSDSPPPSMETLKRVIREPGKEVQIDPHLILLFSIAKEARKKEAEKEELAKKTLITAIGVAEVGVAGDMRAEYIASKTGRKTLRIKGVPDATV